MTRRISFEEWKDKHKETLSWCDVSLYGDMPWEGVRTKIKHSCKTCGHELKPRKAQDTSSIRKDGRRSQGCPKYPCNPFGKKSHTWLNKRLNKVFGKKITVSDWNVKDSRSKIYAHCSVHKHTWTTTTNGLVNHAQDCPICIEERKGERCLQDNIDFINDRFGKGKFNFDETIWSGHKNPLTFTCEKGHVISIISQEIKRRQSLCDECEGRYSFDWEYFLNTLEKKSNGNLVVISKKEDFNNSNSLVDIKCKTHEVVYHRVLAKDIANGHRGCSLCKYEKQVVPVETWVQRFHDAHGDTFEYDWSSYVNGKTAMRTKCKEHGWIDIMPHDHFHAIYGCSKCAGAGGWDSDKPSLCYYIRIDHPKFGTFYKIGVTNNTIERRFTVDMPMITGLWDKKFDTGREALQHEKQILAESDDYLLRKSHGHPYQFLDVLTQNGNHEIFIKDVLNLDTS
jgi:hypothetical protein